MKRKFICFYALLTPFCDWTISLVGVFLCRNTAMRAAVFSPFNSVNIVRCGSKTCSSPRTILIHHLYMKLLEPPPMFWEIVFFLILFLGRPREFPKQQSTNTRNVGDDWIYINKHTNFTTV